jgi:hypothetical protein
VIVLLSGVAGWDALVRAVVLFPVMVVGAWAGGRLFHGLPVSGFTATSPWLSVRDRHVRAAVALYSRQ